MTKKAVPVTDGSPKRARLATPAAAKMPPRRDVVTTGKGQMGVFEYSRGIILVGVPADLIERHSDWMNPDAAAVKAARAAGADAVPFQG